MPPTTGVCARILTVCFRHRRWSAAGAAQDLGSEFGATISGTATYPARICGPALRLPLIPDDAAGVPAEQIPSAVASRRPVRASDRRPTSLQRRSGAASPPKSGGFRSWNGGHGPDESRWTVEASAGVGTLAACARLAVASRRPWPAAATAVTALTMRTPPRDGRLLHAAARC
jgi:hypothetical protein